MSKRRNPTFLRCLRTSWLAVGFACTTCTKSTQYTLGTNTSIHAHLPNPPSENPACCCPQFSETVRQKMLKGSLKMCGIRDAHAKDDNGQTPLHRAAKQGSLKVVQLLLRVPGIEANAKDKAGRTPLHLAAMQGHASVVKTLGKIPGIEANAKDNDQSTPLHWAAVNGYDSVVEALLQLPDIKGHPKNRYGDTPLLLAATRGHASVEKALMQVPGSATPYSAPFYTFFNR